jgi:flagellar basal-body rod protein FlgB
MNTPPILSGIRERMQNLSERQRVISTNIANSETPGYKAREVSEPDFGALVGGSGMVATPRVELTQRMKGLGAVQPAGAGIVLDKDITETKPDGNNVTLEDQLLKMGEIQADFTAMTSLYRKQLSMLKTALGRGGGA